MRYFLFKTRSVCHLRPGELTHSGRKYDIHIAICNLGKLGMDCALNMILICSHCCRFLLMKPPPSPFSSQILCL